MTTGQTKNNSGRSESIIPLSTTNSLHHLYHQPTDSQRTTTISSNKDSSSTPSAKSEGLLLLLLLFVFVTTQVLRPQKQQHYLRRRRYQHERYSSYEEQRDGFSCTICEQSASCGRLRDHSWGRSVDWSIALCCPYHTTVSLLLVVNFLLLWIQWCCWGSLSSSTYVVSYIDA